MKHHEFNFTLYKELFYGQYWQSTNTKAVVILVHGMGEHSSRYAEFVVPSLIQNGFSVVAFDQFGHGKTSGKRGHCPSFEAVLESLDQVIDKAKTVFSDLPLFLYGHSMGGNVVLNYALRKDNNLTGIIASSPFLRLAFQPPKWKLTLGKYLQKIAPSLTLNNELDPKDISRDPIEVQKYINDPLVHDRISPNYSLTFIDTGAWAIENAPNLKTPTLIVHGTGDHIIDYHGSEEFASKTKLATFKSYPNGAHELHNDLCKETLLKDITHWIDNMLTLKNA
ncbi:lysophospholipase [Polaribacter pacificus]|uniref:Monoacylglycerol lipase n=1 Tax=Polaribacter pacificus TaxID=1775173 RepID=A0A917MCZ3_9FLAO|nr:alpha/beta hydrolase [Polaribacter pacificus]GGG95211.1 lysophospholipase [Polaribacter pacificus]